MQLRTRVKFCGITRPEDALEAARVGVDAIGLVFYARSPRAVEPEAARAIVAALPPFVTVVGLFVDAPAEQIRGVLEAVRIDLLQFHGDECPDECRAYGRPYLKAVRMHSGVDVAGYARAYPDAAGLLLDAYQPGTPGGTGVSFDWTAVPRDLDASVVLAGGLTPANVGEAIRQVRPYAVDVSGGVEAAKGIKDPVRMAQFMAAVRDAQ